MKFLIVFICYSLLSSGFNFQKSKYRPSYKSILLQSSTEVSYVTPLREFLSAAKIKKENVYTATVEVETRLRQKTITTPKEAMTAISML